MRTGVPVVGELPVIGHAFSATENIGTATETIVLITPRIIRSTPAPHEELSIMKADDVEQVLDKKKEKLETTLERLSTF
jgi:type II secretory pathway component GspD/PulD (secretin)